MIIYDFIEAFVFRWKLRTRYGDTTLSPSALLFKTQRCFSFATAVVQDNQHNDRKGRARRPL